MKGEEIIESQNGHLTVGGGSLKYKAKITWNGMEYLIKNDPENWKGIKNIKT